MEVRISSGGNLTLVIQPFERTASITKVGGMSPEAAVVCPQRIVGVMTA